MDVANSNPSDSLHVAIIMDGNGRWAKSRFLPRLAGHRQGVKTLKRIVKASPDLGITHLTVYAFSTENWGRPFEEVQGLMNLIREFIKSELAEMHQEGVCFRAIGDKSAFSEDIQELLLHAEETTQNNARFHFQVALNYGGRQDILQATRVLAEKAAKGEITPDQIDQGMFASQLTTQGLPDPDILIRTSGEQRLSNYLLWELSYAEFFFIDEHWPAFTPKTLARILEEYKSRDRRFGEIQEETVEAQA